MEDLRITYEKSKTRESVTNDVKKLSAFFTNTCNNEVFDYAFEKFVDFNSSKISYKCLLECIGKMQKKAAYKCNVERCSDGGVYDKFLE